MKIYSKISDMVLKTRCNFAQLTKDGWIARRTSKNATHGLSFTIHNGSLVNGVNSYRIAAKPAPACKA